MEFRGKNILLISPEDWGHVKVSKHHYALHLSQLGANVTFVNPPTNCWKLTEKEGIQILNYDGFIKGLRYFPSFIQGRIVRSKLKEIESFCSSKFDIIWSFDTSVFINFSLCKTLNIAHLVDLNQSFNRDAVVKSADICFYSSRHIGAKISGLGTPAHFINHGFNLRRRKNLSVEIPGSGKRRVAYAGNLSIPFIAWDVLFRCAKENPSVDFLFIGPIGGEENNDTVSYRNKLQQLNNVFFIGRIESDLLSDYYRQVDALIMCYGEKHYNQASNPHKLLEYLGSGKPIIASYTDEYSSIDSRVIAMSSSDDGYPTVFDTVISRIEEYDDPILNPKRIQIAESNSYSNQLKKILGILTSMSYE